MSHLSQHLRPTGSRRLLTALVVAVVAAAALASPTSAAEGPRVERSADGTVRVVEPALADAPTTTVKGRLLDVEPEIQPVVPLPHGSAPPGSASPDVAPVIVTADGAHVPVDLAADAVEPGATVTAELVSGPRLERALDGDAASPAQVAKAVVTPAAAVAATAHRAYVVRVPASGTLASATALEQRVDRGLAWWTREANGAITSFTRPAATRTLARAATPSDACGFSDVSALWTAAARTHPDVDWSARGNHLVVLVSQSCAGTGIGTVGGGIADGGSLTMVDAADIFTHVLAHELGHNLSLQHANQSCTGCEYWDLYSVMALAVRTTPPFVVPTLDSEYRAQLGVQSSGELAVVPVGTTTTRTLVPRSATSGLRGIEVRRGGTSYWVELRTGTGRDDRSLYDLSNGSDLFGNGRTFPRGVTISTQASGGTGATVLRPRVTATQRVGARKAGQTFTAGALTITVQTFSSSAATVRIVNP